MKSKHALICVAFLLALSVANATVSSRYAKQSTEWFRSAEGRRIADNVLTWQSPHGSWPKNGDTASRPYAGKKDKLKGTFDNGATTGELRFLARAFQATNESRTQLAFLKGLDHIFTAQYPTGGWPQYYPLSKSYHRHITFNDNSMVRILEFLREVSESTDYAFVESDRRAAAQMAFHKGIQCILDCQIVVNGRRTVWCAQHDAVDLRPRPARSYELASLSGGESASILRLLMSLDNPSPEIQRAIRAGAAWYASAKITGIRVVKKPDVGRVVIKDPDAPPLWARFYEIETHRPIFCDRDGIRKYRFNDIGSERRNGYSWYGGWGKDVAEAYGRWKQQWPKTTLSAPLKPRMVVLTDISTWEPDDMESMIRLLVHADLFEIEGLVFTTGWSLETTRDDFYDLIHDVIHAYEKDLPNLLKRSGQTDFLSDESRQDIGYWPSPDYLRSRTVMGSKKRGQNHIGKGNDSPGSKLIIQTAAEKDDRPIWVQAWGGGNTLAQAIWRVREERTEEDLNAFLHKIRMYTITDQDRPQKSKFDISSHQWMRREFEKDLFFIWDECAWKFQNGTGKSNWDAYASHIQKHGHLGSIYPKYKYGVEGDTPAFLYIMPVGLNNPNIPGQGSWGGYFEWAKGPDNKTYAHTNHQNPAKENCYKLEKHFYGATFNNFAARMDWAKDGTGNRNPVVVVNGDEGLEIMTLTPRQGLPVTLDASQSHDPDSDNLTFNWWIISGPGTYTQPINISNSNSNRATVEVPEDSAGKTFHVICEVTDDGVHNLSRYRRIIFEPIAVDGREAREFTSTV